VKNVFGRPLHMTVVVALALIVTMCKGDMGDPGSTGPMGTNGVNGTTGPTGPTGPPGPNLFKSANTGTLITVNANAVTNLTSVSFTAPSAGYALARAIGYCNVSVTGSAEWDVVIGLTATEGFSYNGPGGVWRFSAANTITGAPLEAERQFTVAAGANTFYLNISNIGAAVTDCAGRLTVSFTPTLLQ